MQLTAGFQVAIAAVRGEYSTDGFTVMPIGLDPEAGYEVMSMDFGLVGHATGLELMTGGISLYASPASAAHLLTISPWAEPSPQPEPTAAPVQSLRAGGDSDNSVGKAAQPTILFEGVRAQPRRTRAAR